MRATKTSLTHHSMFSARPLNIPLSPGLDLWIWFVCPAHHTDVQLVKDLGKVKVNSVSLSC